MPSKKEAAEKLYPCHIGAEEFALIVDGVMPEADLCHWQNHNANCHHCRKMLAETMELKNISTEPINIKERARIA